MTSQTRRTTLLAAIASLLIPAAAAHAAETWPARPIHLVVPFPAGGATDLVARILAQQLSADIGQQVVIDNRPGAGGTIGSAEVAKAQPDGDTLLMATSSTHSIGPHLLSHVPYDAVRDFTPIAHVADAASVLLVTPRLPARSVAELVAYATANPGKLNYASSGIGTIPHLTAEAFKSQAGVFIVHVPYKGTGGATADLVAGNVQLIFDAIPSGMPNVRAGRLRALAVTGPRRSPLAPELPTMIEAGLPGFTSVTWFGLYGPRGMDPALALRIHDAAERALHAPATVAALSRIGVDAAPPETPAQFAAMVAADGARWQALMRERHITAD